VAKQSAKVQSLSAFAWSIADILRGDLKQSEYGKVILPFVVLRRLDCLLKESKKAVLEAAATLPDGVDEATRDMILFGAVGGNVKVYNLSRFTFESLRGQEPAQLHANLVDYITSLASRLMSATYSSISFFLLTNSSA
jgi:type I restriction enzyme M protein